MNSVRLSILSDRRVMRVIDVGANIGQYAMALRADGFKGEIVSFEPSASAYAELERAAADDPMWHTHRLALSDAPGRATLNLSANSYSSSLLPVTEASVAAAPDSAFVGTEEVVTATLDSLSLSPAVTFLKVDVQGYEANVLRGALQLLEHVEAVEVELSLVPVYEGQMLAGDMCGLLRDLELVPVALATSFVDPRTGELLQVDGLFVRPRLGSVTSAGSTAPASSPWVELTEDPLAVIAALRQALDIQTVAAEERLAVIEELKHDRDLHARAAEERLAMIERLVKQLETGAPYAPKG